MWWIVWVSAINQAVKDSLIPVNFGLLAAKCFSIICYYTVDTVATFARVIFTCFMCSLLLTIFSQRDLVFYYVTCQIYIFFANVNRFYSDVHHLSTKRFLSCSRWLGLIIIITTNWTRDVFSGSRGPNKPILKTTISLINVFQLNKVVVYTCKIIEWHGLLKYWQTQPKEVILGI